MFLALNLLWFLPFLVWRRSRWSRHRLRNAGIAFGAIIVPASAGLYGFYYVGPCIAPIGCLGGAVVALHLLPLGPIRDWMQLPIPADADQALVYEGIIGSVFWSIAYGLLGFMLDALRLKVQPLRHEGEGREVDAS